MDESVLNAMQRWPDVPAVYGYIGVNRRGEFLLKGHVVSHARTRDFINRNYTLDDQGRAYFQNGPQRAYADLEVTPWVYRLMDDGSLRTHTETPVAELREAWLVPDGDVVLVTELGPGLLHAQDLDALPGRMSNDGDASLDDALAALLSGNNVSVTLTLDCGSVPLKLLDTDNIAARFGVNTRPEPAPGEKAAESEHRPAWEPASIESP